MSRIKNINILDVRNIKEDLAKEISEICNIGFLIESDVSQLLLKDCKKMNVGVTVKAPQAIEVINYSGEIEIDKEYLEGFSKPVIFIVSGSVTFKADVNSKLIEEKIYFMAVQGELICAKNLAGSIQAKCKVQGEILKYNTGHILFKDKFKLTNKFMESLPSKAKLSFNELIVLEPMDKKILEEKIANIQVLNRLVVNEEFENIISEYIEDYYSIDKVILPKSAGNITYIDDDTIINDSSIRKYKDSILFVEGEVEIALEEDIKLEDYIKTLYSEKVICKDKDYDSVKKVLGSDDIEVEIINGKVIRNIGKLSFSGNMDQIQEKISIRNVGKLIFEDNIEIDKFKEKILSIINHGIIIAPEHLMGAVNSKLKENYGKVKSLKEINSDKKESERILYANLLELTL
jgi:hypothetical protein